MKTFVCKVCGHIEFNNAPEACQVCHAPKSAFIEDAAAIKKPANAAALTDPEKKHIPKIVVVKECGLIPGGSCYDAHVKVGEIEHVMEEKHFIRFVDYYVDYKFVARVSFMPAGCHPAAALHLKAAQGKLTAIENCNVHGSWMSEVVL
ncbi:MAG: desulfoferrodoxin family protein [bacterium]